MATILSGHITTPPSWEIDIITKIENDATADSAKAEQLSGFQIRLLEILRATTAGALAYN